MEFLKKTATYLARGLLGLLFVLAGANKLFDWAGTEKMFTSTLADWQMRAGASSSVADLIEQLLPLAPLFLILATLVEVALGLLILLGVREKGAAVSLFFFLIPVTLMFHPFWLFEGVEMEIQAAMFMKNCGIMGGLLLMGLNGAQARGGYY